MTGHTTFAGARVLVADPVGQMAELTCELLQRIGVGVVVKVATSEQALVALSQSAFSAVFLDLMLRPLDPMKLVARIRQGVEGPNANVPVIAIGSTVLRSTVEMAITAGIAKIVSRPASADFLGWSLFSVVRAERPDLDQYLL